MPYRMTPSVRHRAIEVYYYYYYLRKLKNSVDFHCKRCLEWNHVQSVLLRGVEIESNTKLECVPKFCYFGAGGVEEAAIESEWNVLELSSRSYLPSWLPTVHHIIWKERYTEPVFRVCWHMGLKRRQWILKICKVWRRQSIWWWGGCVDRKRSSESKNCAVFF